MYEQYVCWLLWLRNYALQTLHLHDNWMSLLPDCNSPLHQNCMDKCSALHCIFHLQQIQLAEQYNLKWLIMYLMVYVGTCMSYSIFLNLQGVKLVIKDWWHVHKSQWALSVSWRQQSPWSYSHSKILFSSSQTIFPTFELLHSVH